MSSPVHVIASIQPKWKKHKKLLRDAPFLETIDEPSVRVVLEMENNSTNIQK